MTRSLSPAALLAARSARHKWRGGGLVPDRPLVLASAMVNEIAALDRPPPRVGVSHLIGPGIDRAATIQTHLDEHAAEGIAGLCGALIVVELGKQPLGVLD